MNALLKQTLEEHAADGPAPYVDPVALEALGRRRVRRRRVAVGAGALALVAVVGVAAPSVVGAGDPERPQVAVDPGAPAPVSWAVGSTVRVGDREVELPQPPAAYVLNDDGIVWVDADGQVLLTDEGGASRTLGVTRTGSGRVLVAGGPYAAWYDPTADEFVVHDTAAGREVDRFAPLAGDRTGEDDAPAVLALDGTDLWTYSGGQANERRLVGRDDEVRVFSADGSDDFRSAADRRVAFAAVGDQQVEVFDGQSGLVGSVPGGGRAVLSPDARYLATDPNDSEQVFEVATGEDVTPDPGDAYGFQAVAQWLDADTYQAIAFTREELQASGGDAALVADVLTCSVGAGSCTVLATDVGTLGDLQLPMGEDLGE